MRNDKHIALKLRKQGRSYNKISKELGIPKSTLSEWFSRVDWSQEVKAELTRRANYVSRKRLQRINKKRREEWEIWREGFRKRAKKDFPKLIHNPLFVCGVALYWGEGDHRLENGQIRLVNTDPRMINLFSKFLREIVGVPPNKLYPWLILYNDLSEKECLDFWSKTSGISRDQFRKTQVIKGRHPTRKTTYGMCVVQTNSRGLKEQIFTWIELLSSLNLK